MHALIRSSEKAH